MEPSKKELVAKIVKVIEALGAIPKSSKNAFQNYNYRSHEDIMNKLQPSLVAAGLVMVPKAKKILSNEPGYVLLEATYEITDGVSSIDFVGIGEGVDKSKEGRAGDKAAYKAQTGAIKYALNDLFVLASKEDPEADNETHKHAEQEKAETASTPTRFVIPEKTYSLMVDMMNAMGWSDKKQTLVFQKAELVGADKALAGVQSEYAKFIKPTVAEGKEDVSF